MASWPRIIKLEQVDGVQTGGVAQSSWQSVESECQEPNNSGYFYGPTEPHKRYCQAEVWTPNRTKAEYSAMGESIQAPLMLLSLVMKAFLHCVHTTSEHLPGERYDFRNLLSVDSAKLCRRQIVSV